MPTPTAPHMIILVGLPASGKSTRSTQLAAAGYRVISTDAIRAEITGSAADQSQNPRVVAIAHARAYDALEVGDHVVIDATNLLPEWRQPWLNIAAVHGATVTIERLQTPLIVCLWRNYCRSRRVPIRVMWRMWRM